MCPDVLKCGKSIEELRHDFQHDKDYLKRCPKCGIDFTSRSQRWYHKKHCLSEEISIEPPCGNIDANVIQNGATITIGDNSNNNNIIVDNRVTIVLHPFASEQIEYFWKDEQLAVTKIFEAIKFQEYGLTGMACDRYFNIEHPENNNIQVPYEDSNDVRVWNGVEWVTQNIFSVSCQITKILQNDVRRGVLLGLNDKNASAETICARKTSLKNFMRILGSALNYCFEDVALEDGQHNLSKAFSFEVDKIQKRNTTLYRKFIYTILPQELRKGYLNLLTSKSSTSYHHA